MEPEDIDANEVQWQETALQNVTARRRFTVRNLHIVSHAGQMNELLAPGYSLHASFQPSGLGIGKFGPRAKGPPRFTGEFDSTTVPPAPRRDG